MTPKKTASACICLSCRKKSECDYFTRYAGSSKDSDSEKGFSIEIMECDDFKQ